MAIEGAAPSLRDVLMENASLLDETPSDTPAPPVIETAAPLEGVKAAEIPGDRIRDEKGRFAPGSPEDKAEKAKAAAPAIAPQAPTRPAVPQSWKQDYRPHWEKLDPQIAAYIAQREDEAAAGIGKHRGEAERLRVYEPIGKAIEPFADELKRYGIQPETHITNLFHAHRSLALGSPQDKLAMFAQLAQQYQVPLGGLFVQDANGQIQFNQNLLRQAPQPASQPQQPPVDIRKEVTNALLEHETAREIAAFEAQKDKYPHYEKLKEDMALFLQQGRAKDLPGAYSLALRLHDDLWAEEQKRQREHSETERRAAEAKAAKEARARAVSPRSVTPSATSAAGNSGGKKSLRDTLIEHSGILDGADARV